MEAIAQQVTERVVDLLVSALDVNELAASIVDQATSGKPKPDPDAGKNPAAVELGRLGGKKGGKARAQKLSAKKRSDIARRAARARWEAPSQEERRV